eukprot:6061489-Pleurochrysis_carterae.AAC.1
MADLLSIWSDVGSVDGSPRSSKRVRKYTASFAASDAAIISASVVRCFGAQMGLRDPNALVRTSDAARQHAKAVEVPKFAAVPIELRRKPSSSPASERGETESAAKRIFGRAALEASADLLAQEDEQMTHRGTPTTPLNARSREGTGLRRHLPNSLELNAHAAHGLSEAFRAAGRLCIVGLKCVWMDEQGNWLQAQKLDLGQKGPLDINHVVFSRRLHSKEIAEPLYYMSDGDAWPYRSEAVPEKG